MCETENWIKEEVFDDKNHFYCYIVAKLVSSLKIEFNLLNDEKFIKMIEASSLHY